MSQTDGRKLSWTCRSGSSSTWFWRPYTSPVGSRPPSSPRRAFCKSPPRKRARITWSSTSLMVPFKPATDCTLCVALCGCTVRITSEDSPYCGQAGQVRRVFWRERKPWVQVRFCIGGITAVPWAWTDLPVPPRGSSARRDERGDEGGMRGLPPFFPRVPCATWSASWALTAPHPEGDVPRVEQFEFISTGMGFAPLLDGDSRMRTDAADAAGNASLSGGRVSGCTSRAAERQTDPCLDF
jgi:hypothetical protein